VVAYNEAIYYSEQSTRIATNLKKVPSASPAFWEQIRTVGNTISERSRKSCVRECGAGRRILYQHRRRTSRPRNAARRPRKPADACRQADGLRQAALPRADRLSTFGDVPSHRVDMVGGASNCERVSPSAALRKFRLGPRVSASSRLLTPHGTTRNATLTEIGSELKKPRRHLVLLFQCMPSRSVLPITY
jgi:hypothetical protein